MFLNNLSLSLLSFSNTLLVLSLDDNLKNRRLRVHEYLSLSHSLILCVTRFGIDSLNMSDIYMGLTL